VETAEDTSDFGQINSGLEKIEEEIRVQNLEDKDFKKDI